MNRVATTIVLAAAGLRPAHAQSISGVKPANPYPGHPVTISGSNLSGASNVSYNGTSVAFTVVNNSKIRARVPTGATADGRFEVTTDGGTATSSAISLDTEPGLYGPRRALAVDGSGDYVATGANGSDLGLADESFSVGVWFKLNSTADDRTLVGMDERADDETLHLVIKDDRTARFGFYNNDLDTPSGTVTTGTWTHLTFVYDASTGDRFIYKNGEQVASDNPSSHFQGTSKVLIGRWGGDKNYFDGEIDQVRVWKGALSAAEVRERAYRTIAPGEAAFGELEGAWRLDAGGTTTAFEQTANYRFGTFQGDPQRVAASGARLGQESVSTTGADVTVGPSGGTLSATGVSAGSDEAVQLYRFGTTNGPTRDGSDAGEDGLAGTERSNLTWGLATNGSPSADLEINYSGVQGISDPVALIRRDGPGNAWQEPSGWTHDSGAQTFTNSGTVPEGQYAVASAVVYVDESATGVGDGSSWADAYTDLQTAIDNAFSSSEIWVAEGIYKPDSEGDSFTITGNKDGLEVYGGFDATESNRDERDPTAHRTILSGDIDGDDNTDADGMTPTAGDINGDNAHHVLFLDGGDGIDDNVSDNVTSSTVLDGLVITAGQADGHGPNRSGPNSLGGGLFCDGEGSGNACSPTLANALFAGNEASDDGGAIYNNGRSGDSSPSITGATFTGNTASNDGGAIYNHGFQGTSSPSITNATFTGNEAGKGGAIFNNGYDRGTSSPSITNATFTGNTASFQGGAIYNNGAYGTSSPTVANTILWGNSASDFGDEIYNDEASPTLTHTIIEGGSNNGDGTNLNKDPQFEDPSSPAGEDGTFATRDDGVNVGAGSPALDAGDNNEIPDGVDEDITGAARIQDRDGDGTATVNIGAYEEAFLDAPVAQTGSASNIGGTTAALGGTVNPKGLETTVEAQVYPTSDPSAVRTLTAAGSPLTGDTDQSVTVPLDGLSPDTEYKARVLANNEDGVDQGSLVTFTTAAGYTRTIAGTDGTGNDAGWRMLALPAAGKTRAALEDNLEFSVNSGSILYRWTSGSWTAQEKSDDDLPRGRGFMLFFFDDVIDPIGSEGLPLAVGTGNEDQSTDHQVSGLPTDETFHLLGNPFDVAFDLSALNLSGQGFQQTVQIWDPSSESYTTITQGDDDEIGAWQGFFVERSTPGEGEERLTFSTDGKQSGNGDLIGSQSAALADTKRSDEKRLRLGLRLAVLDTTSGDPAPPSPQAAAAQAVPSREPPDSLAGSAAAQSSEAAQVDTIGTGRLGLLLSSDAAKAGWDAYEASQLGPPGGGQAAVTISSPLEQGPEESVVQRTLASEPYPGENAAVTVPVSMQARAGSGQATLRLSDAQREQVPPGWALRLTDTRAGEQADLLTEAYRFTLDEKGETGATAPPESRFRLAVGPRGALPTPDGLALEAPYPNPTTQSVTVEYAVPQDKADGAQLQLYDVLGRRVRTVSVKPGPRTQRLDVSGLASGVYVLRLTAEGAQQTRKLTVVR